MDLNTNGAETNPSSSKAASAGSSSVSGSGNTSASGSVSNSTPAKRHKLSQNKLNLNENIMKSELLEQLKQAWSTGAEFEESNLVSLSSDPFTHAEITDFIQDEEFMSSLVEILNDGTIFHDKASDLFQFEQSDDLKSIPLKEVKTIRSFFEDEVLDFMTRLTGFPLNGTVDMFFSNYQRNDFLLCHDDELESRRIAFILYLSPKWKPEFGGSLDLYHSTEDIQPTTIAKSINPTFNKFVFFDVTCKSFHQVSEVLEPGVERFALSGWFYGDPISRPQITFPTTSTHNLLENVTEHSLKNPVTVTYTQEDNFPLINQQLEENSEVLLVDFLEPEAFEQLCEEVKALEWEATGPVNICSYLTSNIKLWPEVCTGNSTVHNLSKLFHSKEVLHFLEQITEFPFTSGTATLVSSQLRKYKHRSYELLRSRGSESKPEPEPNTSADDDDAIEEEPTHVDLIYYFGEFEWDEDFGGLTVYNDAEGEQLITVTPNSNSLAVIVRGKSVASYVNYVNSLAKDSEFCTYTMTFAFNGIL